jgi:hypothetical protein
MSIEKYHNDNGVVSKPQELVAVIPEYITECAVYLNKPVGEPCSDNATITAIAAALDISEKTPEKIMDEALVKTSCNTERCVISKMNGVIGQQNVKTLLSTRFKVLGPVDNTLLNNYNIDETLKQFRNKFSGFFPYNFNMLNYREYSFQNGRTVPEPDTLETIQVAQLIGDFKCAGCVINTDTYQGSGKHWMALFADWRDPNNASVEFFNSSGNAPAAPWILWMERTRDALETSGHKLKNGLSRISSKRHQHSKTECGVYSIFYIYARLNGIKPEYFTKNFIPDQLMFEFRQHLFDGDDKFVSGIKGSKERARKFDWDEYSKKVSLKWET